MKRRLGPLHFLQLTLAGLCLLGGVMSFVFFDERYISIPLASLAFLLAGVNVYTCLLLLAYQARVERLYDEKSSALERFMQTKNRCVTLQREVEALSEMRELHLAANVGANFEHRIHDIMSTIKNIVEAQEITLFLVDSQKYGPAPKAHYCRDEKKEVFLYFKQEMEEIPPGALKPQKLTIALHQGNNLELGAPVKLGGNVVGNCKVKLFLEDGRAVSRNEQSVIFREILEDIVIGTESVFEALEWNRPFHSRQGNLYELTLPMMANEEVIGVIKAKFPITKSEDEADDGYLKERQEKLESALKEIAQAIKKEELFEESIRDGLTGLFIKRYFEHQLGGYHRVARAHNRRLTLMMIDIDHFKKVNDTYGHLTGDIVLKGVARVFRESIRNNDSAYRYGGEELAILLPEVNEEEAFKIADRLRIKLEKTVFYAEDGQTRVPVTVSIGLAEVTAATAKPQDLIGAADRALYEAKHTGRNKVVMSASLPAPAKTQP